ncbi:ATP-binding cassette domain-containing protein [Streptomyces alkaliterrae]|uniref:ATP-binding cassette domain-containing protein n=1 Tax=Streptomyces alkaliterrae TaxID=2213162 RepID=A0A7W3ZTR3_9ACTN|nr:ATP-binding cassette domain-containing protein [Streptomyces alkaliterrae]MBB1253874.1 ATP-binding cassette domain-containing protein [Streptomyces alkaliterrae]MBB1260143.1 ATP-binding cassette domain-containing protein [Streptomyces alkaliterrae]
MIDLRVRTGAVTVLLGGADSGAFRLLRVLGLLTPPDGGRVLLDGRDTSRLPRWELADIRRDRFGYVLPECGLLPRHSAGRNVLLPYDGRYGPADERAALVLERVGVPPCRASYRPDELSESERCRVVLARALVNGPSAVLVEEPTAGLPEAEGRRLLTLLGELADEGRAVVITARGHDVLAAAHEVHRLTAAGLRSITRRRVAG